MLCPTKPTITCPLILALTIMAKNPKDYDLENLDSDPPVEYDTIDLDSPTSLALVADAADRPVSEIQELNPALLKTIAPGGLSVTRSQRNARDQS